MKRQSAADSGRLLVHGRYLVLCREPLSGQTPRYSWTLAQQYQIHLPPARRPGQRHCLFLGSDITALGLLMTMPLLRPARLPALPGRGRINGDFIS